MTLQYKRVLLKLSGEALEKEPDALDPETLRRVASEIKRVVDQGCEVGVVIGGGNFFRGAKGAAKGMNRSSADTMGMLATLMNCIAMQDALFHVGQAATLLSSIPVIQICEGFSRRRALAAFEDGHVVLCAGGTGNPYFTTDSAASLRALEIDAEVLLKATKVDGVYDKDPVKHADAERFTDISYDEVIHRKLRVMDLTAVTLCRDNALPMVVFDMSKSGNINRVISGEDVGTRIHS